MKFKHSISIIIANALALILASCSQPVQTEESVESINPNEVTINLDDYIPDKPKLLSNILISEHSIEGTPVYKPPPAFPARAEKSGHCVFTLQVNLTGNVESVKDIKCSDDIFKKHAQKNLLKWKFNLKKNEHGQSIAFQYGPQKLIFRLIDEDGNMIPE